MIRNMILALAASASLGSFSASAASKPVQAPKPTAQPQQQVLQPPAPEAVVIMIRSSLLALSQANQTNNYSVLNALGSPGFRLNNPPQKLSQAFEQFRANRIDIAPVVFVAPQLTAQPTIDKGKLKLVGLFPTQPMQVKYDLSYEAVGGQWMLSDIAVNLERRVAAR